MSKHDDIIFDASALGNAGRSAMSSPLASRSRASSSVDGAFGDSGDLTSRARVAPMLSAGPQPPPTHRPGTPASSPQVQPQPHAAAPRPLKGIPPIPLYEPSPRLQNSRSTAFAGQRGGNQLVRFTPRVTDRKHASQQQHRQQQ